MEEFQLITPPPGEEDVDSLRRGPWTAEEDILLINYVAVHGEGKWNSLARSAGLRRTGKSCRLRWLNYLRPDVRRGNITPEEQLLILELHSRWGNRWSKIAQYLPGRTDNEIKNYWRTRVQKHAEQLKCDVNSRQFKDVMRHLWMPRLLERIRSASGEVFLSSPATTTIPLAASDRPEPDRAAGEVPMNLSPDYSSSAAGSSSTTTADSSSFDVQLSPPPVSAQGADGELSAVYWTELLPCPAAAAHPDLALPDLDQILWGETSFWGMEDDFWLQQPF